MVGRAGSGANERRPGQGGSAVGVAQDDLAHRQPVEGCGTGEPGEAVSVKEGMDMEADGQTLTLPDGGEGRFVEELSAPYCHDRPLTFPEAV